MSPVLKYLASISVDGVATASAKTISDHVDREPRSVMRAIARLEKAGMVKRVHNYERGGRQGTNTYLLGNAASL